MSTHTRTRLNPPNNRLSRAYPDGEKTGLPFPRLAWLQFQGERKGEIVKTPLTYSTVPEAAAWLAEATGTPWSDNELLDAAGEYGITLHAGPPISARARIAVVDFEGVRDGSNPEGFKTKHETGWRMAELFPIHIEQILHAGETETVHAGGHSDAENGEYDLFHVPVKVTREQVRVSANAVRQILSKRQKDVRRNRNAVDAAPSGAPEKAAPPAPVVTPAPAANLRMTKTMRDAFPPPKGVSAENWKKTLSWPPKWLKDARKSDGGPGISALWNPAMFALCMVSEGHIGKDSARIIITREFTDWLIEWERLSEHL